MKKVSAYDKYSLFVIVSTIIVSFITIISNKAEQYEGMQYIPIAYVVLFTVNKALHCYSKKNKGLLLVNILMYIKYVFAIFIIVMLKDYSEPSFYCRLATQSSYSTAIVYMIIELVSINFIILLLGKYFYR